MEYVNPALYENGQYLEEWDPINKNKYSDAATKAQEKKLRRLMENRPPRDVLPRAELASRRVKPPLYYYGCPFTFKYALDYCKRHLLEIELAEEDMQYFGGKAVFNLADVDETHLSNPDLRVFLFTTAAFMMIKDLSAKCGMPLLCGRPFSQEWDGIVALWSNYDIKDRILMCSHFQTVVDTLSAGMNEEGHVSKPQWWFDWDNDVGVFTSID